MLYMRISCMKSENCKEQKCECLVNLIIMQLINKKSSGVLKQHLLSHTCLNINILEMWIFQILIIIGMAFKSSNIL